MFHRGRCNVFTAISPGGTDGLPCPAQDLVLQPQDPSGSRSGREERGRGCRLLGARVARSAPVPQQTPAPRRGGAGCLDSGRAGGFGHAKGPFFSPLLALVTQPVALLHTIAGDKILLECG